jgi:hypothetical protein
MLCYPTVTLPQFRLNIQPTNPLTSHVPPSVRPAHMRASD